MFFGEDDEIGDAGHFAIGLHDLDDDRGGFEMCEAAEIDRAFGLTGADECAAGAGAEGVDVAGAEEIGGAELRVDGHLDAFSAFFGRDSGGAAVFGMEVDGDGEGCAAGCGVYGGLGVELEAVALIFGEREAHVTERVLEHEGDCFGRGELGGEDKVAFVLAIFVIGEDDHFASAEIGEAVFDW